MNKFLFFLTLLHFSLEGAAQKGFGYDTSLSCGTDSLWKELLKDSSIYNINRQIELKLLQYKKSLPRPSTPQSTITLPVVIHIIHNNGVENISDVRVLAGIQHLNEAFANAGYYDPSSGVNTNIQFCLAQRAPNGNGTTGITRNVSAVTNMNGPYYNSDDLNVKNINRWDPGCYINIWLVNDIPGPVAGYAFLPAMHGTNVDGIIMEASYWGSSYSNDIVIIHEMGHYLGLYHTFEEGCHNDNCTTDGDKVCDTPPDNSTSSTSCNLTVNSCSTDILSGFTKDQDDLTQDYMDYGNWDCMSVFTQGQADRMNWHILNVRSSLMNCLSCLSPCQSPVVADFISGSNMAQAGTNINFTNSSLNGATYSWYIDGKLVSTAYNYNQVFTQPGTYYIKLITKSSDPAVCVEREKTDSVKITCGTRASFTPGYNGVSLLNDNIPFVNTSTGATSFEWYYDNSLVEVSTNYIANFTALGNHYVKLVASSAYCKDSMLVYYVINSPAGGNMAFQKKYYLSSNTTPDNFKSNYSLITPDQHIIHAGGSEFSNNTVAKYTDKGDIVWSKSFVHNNPWASRIVLKKIIYTNDGNIVFFGDAFLNAEPGPAIIKTDLDGNIIWNRYFYEKASVTSTDIIELPDGSFVISGNYYYGYLVLYKVSANSQLLWRKTLAYGDFEFYYGSLQSIGNDVYFSSGISDRAGAYNLDGFVMKINPENADIIFGKKYDYKGIANRFRKIKAIDSKLVIEGDFNAINSTPPSKKTMLTTDLDGNVKDFKLIYYPNIDVGSSDADLFINKDKKILFSLVDAGSFDSHVLVFDENLSLVNGKTYPQTERVVPNSIDQFSNGDYLISQNYDYTGNVLVRTLPDLSKLPCNSFDFVPSIETDVMTVTDITQRLAYSNNFTQVDTTLDILIQSNNLNASVICSNEIPPICDTSICNVFQLEGPMQICKKSDAVTIVLKRSSNCSLVPIWTFSDTSSYQLLAQTDSFVKLKLTGNGMLWIKVKALSACRIFEDSLFVIVDESPSSVDLGADIKLCNASTIQLHAGAGFKFYRWQDGSTDSTFTAYMPGIYYVTASDACGNDYRDTINISLAPDVVFDLGPDKQLCAGDTILLSAPAGFSDYNWSPDFTINTIYGQTVKVWPGVDTTYTVTALKTLGCSVLDSIKIKINPVRQIHLGHDTSFCEGGYLNLNAGSNFNSYQWSNGSLSQSVVASSAGIYSVKAFDNNGCISKDTIRILGLYPAPVINLGSDKNLCENDSIVLDAGGGYPAYQWQNNSVNQIFTVHAPGVYWVKVKNNSGCTAADTLNVLKIVPKPIINLGKDTSFCDGQIVELSPGAKFITYTWQDNSHNKTFNATQQGIYRVTVTDTNNCVATDTLNIIELYPQPILNIGRDTILCKGQSITLNAGTGFQTYFWQDKPSGQFFTANTKGYYQAKVVDPAGCAATDTLQIIDIVDPPNSFVAKQYTVCNNRSEYIRPVGNFNSYLWYDGSKLDSILVTMPGNYWLTVKDFNGCEAKENFDVVIENCINAFYFPNAFSPNNDNLNEIFRPKLYGNIVQYHLVIFNRLGSKIFETTDYSKGWNGIYKNVPQNIGAYVWICRFKLQNKPEQIQKGSVVLVR